MTEPFQPIAPRVSPTIFRGHTGVLLDLPGQRGRGTFIPQVALTRVIDALVAIEDEQP